MYPISHLSLSFCPDFVILEVWDFFIAVYMKHYAICINFSKTLKLIEWLGLEWS